MQASFMHAGPHEAGFDLISTLQSPSIFPFHKSPLLKVLSVYWAWVLF